MATNFQSETPDLAEYARIFNEFTHEDGGAVDFSWLDPHYHGRCKKLLSAGQIFLDTFRTHHNSVSDIKMPYIHFGMVSNPDLQAYAFTSEGKYFIGVFFGTVMVLEDLFFRIMAHKDIFPHIGNPSDEANTPPTLPYLALDFMTLYNLAVQGEINGQTVPQNPERLKYSQSLIMVALNFLLAHELAHLVFGHVDYIEQKLGGRTLNEVGDTNIVGLPALTSQAFEINADSIATSHVNRILSTGIIEGLKLGSPGGIDPEPALMGELLTRVFAIHSMLVLFAAAEDPTAPPLSLSHPPARLRQRNNITVIIKRLKSTGHADIVDRFLEEGAETMLHAERCIALISRQRFDISPLTQVFGQEGAEYLNGVLGKHWFEVVCPALVPFTKIEFREEDTRPDS